MVSFPVVFFSKYCRKMASFSGTETSSELSVKTLQILPEDDFSCNRFSNSSPMYTKVVQLLWLWYALPMSTPCFLPPLKFAGILNVAILLLLLNTQFQVLFFFVAKLANCILLMLGLMSSFPALLEAFIASAIWLAYCPLPHFKYKCNALLWGSPCSWSLTLFKVSWSSKSPGCCERRHVPFHSVTVDVCLEYWNLQNTIVKNSSFI